MKKHKHKVHYGTSLKITENGKKIYSKKGDNLDKMLTDSFRVLKAKYDFVTDNCYINEDGNYVKRRKRR